MYSKAGQKCDQSIKSKFCYQYDDCKSVLTEEKENFLSSETTCPSYECNKIGHCEVRLMFC